MLRYRVDIILGTALDRLREALEALEECQPESREIVCIEARSVLTNWMGQSRVRQDALGTELVGQTLKTAESMLKGQDDDCYQMVSKRLRRFLKLVDDPRRLRLPVQLLEAIENLDDAVEAHTDDVCHKAKLVLDTWEANLQWSLGTREAELLRDILLKAQTYFGDAPAQLRADVESALESTLLEYGFNVSTSHAT